MTGMFCLLFRFSHCQSTCSNLLDNNFNQCELNFETFKRYGKPEVNFDDNVVLDPEPEMMDPQSPSKLSNGAEMDSDPEDDPGKLLNQWLGQLDLKKVNKQLTRTKTVRTLQIFEFTFEIKFLIL